MDHVIPVEDMFPQLTKGEVYSEKEKKNLVIYSNADDISFDVFRCKEWF